jgi:hypothetical protein
VVRKIIASSGHLEALKEDEAEASGFRGPALAGAEFAEQNSRRVTNARDTPQIAIFFITTPLAIQKISRKNGRYWRASGWLAIEIGVGSRF